MEKENIFQANFDKSNDFCFYFSKCNQTKNLIGKIVKFLNFQLISMQNSQEIQNLPVEKSYQNISIILNTTESVIPSSKILLAQVILNNEEKGLHISHLANTLTKICEKSHLKLEATNSDKQEYFIPDENKYFIKVTYENSYDKNNISDYFNNIQSNTNTSDMNNYLHMLKGNFSEEDEEDEDYEESQLDSAEKSVVSCLSEDCSDNEVKNKSNISKELPKENLSCEDEEGDEDFVKDLFEEAEDINRDLIYLEDEELGSDSYLNLFLEEDKHNPNRNNIYNNINPNPGKKRYMLRRKRKPYN